MKDSSYRIAYPDLSRTRLGRLLIFPVILCFVSLGYSKSLHVPDPALEEALARTLQVAKGELTEELLASKLTRFQLNGAGIQNLTGLEAATKLQSLILRNNLIEDITPITGLAYLRQLDLSGNRIRTLKPLDDLAGGAFAIRVSEITKAAQSPQLLPSQSEALRLELVTILKKNAKGPWQLEELRVGNNRLRGLSGIGKHLALRYLDASNNGLVDLEGISNLSSLEVLHLQGNQLGFVEPFEDINKNEAFDQGEPFTDTSGNGKRDHDPFGELGNHPRLRELYLYENRITNLASMGNLPRLENLLLGGNELTNAADLSGLKTIKRLALTDNNLSEIQGLAELIGLEYLYLTENRLSDLRPLRKLISLRELHLQHNHLADMSPIANLSELRVLGLSGNFLKDLGPVEGMQNLRRIVLSDNSFSLHDSNTERIIEELRTSGARVIQGKQTEVSKEMSRLLFILMRDKKSNRILGDYLKANRYERLFDYVRDETISIEEKIARYDSWSNTLEDGSFDPKTPFLEKVN